MTEVADLKLHYYSPGRVMVSLEDDITKKLKVETLFFDSRLDPFTFSVWLANMNHYFDCRHGQRLFAKMKLQEQA